MHEVLVNGLEGLSLSMKNVVRLTDRPVMTIAVYRGRKTSTVRDINNNVHPILSRHFHEGKHFKASCLYMFRRKTFKSEVYS